MQMQEVPNVTSASGACCKNTTMLISMGLGKEDAVVEKCPGWHYLSTTAEAPKCGGCPPFCPISGRVVLSGLLKAAFVDADNLRKREIAWIGPWTLS